MSTIVYIPRSLQFEVVDLPVLCVYASCYEKEVVRRDNVDTGKYTNHWVFFCAITKAHPSASIQAQAIRTRRSHSV